MLVFLQGITTVEVMNLLKVDVLSKQAVMAF